MRQTLGLSLRNVVSLFALLAFVFSGFATQTHIHIPAQAELGFAASAAPPPSIAAKSAISLDREQKQRAPADDPTRCPLCQEYLHAGVFVTPVPLTVPLPLLTESVAPLLLVPLAVFQAVSHSWHGRAPPLS